VEDAIVGMYGPMSHLTEEQWEAVKAMAVSVAKAFAPGGPSDQTI